MNHWLVDAVSGLPGTTVHDLYEEYPDFDIDVHREQALLLEHAGIVFHHPFFWYSTPAILKQWQDLVLQHGWAYGSEGTALYGAGWDTESLREQFDDGVQTQERTAPEERDPTTDR